MQERSPNNCILMDISHWNGVVNFDQVAAFRFPDGRKVSGVIFKATEGATMIDDMLGVNFQNAKAHGLAVGLYHFLRSRNTADGVKEAKFFLSVLESLGGVQAVDIVPALDLEYDSPTKQTLKPAEVIAASHAWLETVQQSIGFSPMLYSYPSMMQAYLDDSFASYPLWLSYPERGEQPNDVRGFTRWKMLQYTFNGQVSGVAGAVDLNEYDGGEGDLMYKMDAKIAQDLIAICKSHYDLSVSQADKDAWHARADEIRKAAQLPADA